jgi:hypothetical protein
MGSVIQQKEELRVAQDRLAAVNFTFKNAESRLMHATENRDRLQESFAVTLRRYVGQRRLPVVLAVEEAKEALATALAAAKQAQQLSQDATCTQAAKAAAMKLLQVLPDAREKMDHLRHLTQLRSWSQELDIALCSSCLNGDMIIALLDENEPKWNVVFQTCAQIAKILEQISRQPEAKLEELAVRLEQAEEFEVALQQERMMVLEREFGPRGNY